MNLDEIARRYGGAPVTDLDKLAQQFGGAISKPAEPAAPSTERTFTEAATDVAASALKGLGSLAQFPGQVVKLLPGMQTVGEALETPGEYIAKTGEDLKSTGLKAREALRSKALTEAEKEGVLSQFATAITTTIKDPALLTSFISEQVPLLIGPLGAAKVTQLVGRKGVAAAGEGLTGEAATTAMSEAAKRLNTQAARAAIGTGAAMQGSSVGSETYENAFQAAVQQGMSPEQAKEEALKAARIAAGGATATSLATAGLLSRFGGTAIERRLAGVPGMGRAPSAVGEATSEALEESGGQLFQNIALRQIDPNQSLTAGVGAAAGLGALGGGFFGGLLGKKPDVELAPGQKPGETLAETAQRLNQEIKALDEMARMTESDQTRTDYGLKTNSELVDMYRTQGAGAVKQYQQQLAQMIRSDTPVEQKVAAAEAVKDIQNFLTQAAKEEYQRKAASVATNVLTDKEVAINMGIPRADPIYRALLGKDIGKPEDAQAVVQTLEGALNRKGLRQSQRERFATALTNVNEYLATIPGSGFYATVQPPIGEGAGVAGVTGERPAAPRAGEPEPTGVVRPETVAGELVGGEGVQPPPVEPAREEVAAAPVPAAPAPAVEAPAPAPATETVEERYKRLSGRSATMQNALRDKYITREQYDAYFKELEDARAQYREEQKSRIGELSPEAQEASTIADQLEQANQTALANGIRLAVEQNQVTPDKLAFYKQKLAQTQQVKTTAPATAVGLDAVLNTDEKDAGRLTLVRSKGQKEDIDLLDQVDQTMKALAQQARDAGFDINDPAAPPAVKRLKAQYSGLGGGAARLLIGQEAIIKGYKRANQERAAKDREELKKDIENAQSVAKKSVRPETEARAAEILKKREAEPQAAPEAELSQADAYKASRALLVKQLDGILKRILAKYGLKDVKLNIDEALQDEGSYARQVITLALNIDNPVRTLRHESIHALKDMGFFTDAQWKTLTKRAETEWIQALKDRVHSPTQSRYDAYIELFNAEGKAKGLTGDALNDYVQEALIEEAIADAFGEFDAKKAPPGLMQSILNRMRNLFKAIKEAFGQAGIDSAEDIFGKIEEGKLKPTKEIAPKVEAEPEVVKATPSIRPQESNAWQASDTERQEALDMYNEDGFLPYVSQGFLNVPLDGKKYSLQKYNPDKHLAFDPVLNVPINKDGTITAYYHTTKAGALNINNNKMIAAEGRNRIYLTNESGGADVLRNRGSFDQDLDGSTVLVYVTPDMLQVDQMYDNGRVDFFIPLAQGEYFNKKMKMQSIQKARTEAIAQEFSYDDHEEKITKAVEKYKAAPAGAQKAMVKRAKEILKREHNVSSLLTENGKLEKTRIGEYDLSYDGLPVASQGLGLASAQKITEKTSTCPRSSICEGLCLGETSGGNFMFGGAAAEDVGDIQKSAFRAGARMMQYLKTEALIVHPQEFAVLLQSEIDALKRWSEKPTQRKKNPETGKVETIAKEIYAPAVRLNVTSDFKPEMFRGVIEGNPDVMFYDYTKINSNSIADNHHLTYSSTGFGQIVDGERVFFKNKAGNYDHNWGTVRQRLNDGFNVAMAFSSKSGLPKTLTDEETKIVYKVLDGDLYDARFLDEYSPEKRDSEGRGVIVGLRNKAGTLSEKNATQKTGGFFVNYDPKRDGNNVTVPDQAQFKPRRIPIAAKPSLRTAPDTPQFKFWFGKSTIVDKDGNPKVMYHGTGKDYEILGTGRRQANAIFLTDDPEFAEKFAKDTFMRAASEAAKGVGISEDAFKQGIKRAVEAIRKDYGSSAEGKAMIADVRKGYDNASPEAQEYMTKAFRDAVPAGPNIIPVYVKAEYPFDYENPEHVAILAKMLTPDSIPSEENRKKLEQTLAQSIAKGDWEKIERPEAQAIIRQLGFDGFYVQEGGRKSLAVYNPNQVKSVFNQAPTEAPELRKSLRSGAERFNQEEIQKQVKPGNKSRYKLIEMPIDDFLSLADAGIVRTKTENARAILKRGDNFETIPNLSVDEDGQVYGHEGRHRARALKELGYTSMPVELRMVGLRWSEQLDPNNPDYKKVWPKTLKAQEKAEDPSFSIPFPVKQEDSMKPYGVKPSLRSLMTPQVKATVDKIAPPTYTPNLPERILNAVSGDTFTKIRQAAVNRYERLAEYDRRVAREIQRMGGVQQLADSKAETAALFSDLGAGILETAMGAHDRFGGVPVFKNGVTVVSNFGRTIKGPIAIFKPLSDLKDPDVFRLYQTWSAVKRGSRLNVEGREQLIDQADIAAINAMERANPQLTALFKEVQKDWLKYNNALVKYMVDTGVITPAMAKEYTKHGDYFPFYRLVEEDVAGPKMFTSIGNVRAPKKLKGGEGPLGDFFENIIRNSQAAIQAGIKNTAAQRATEQALRLNEVTRLDRKATGASIYRVLENGQEVFYQAHDPLFIEAIKALNMPDLPFIGLLAGPANLLRNLVTKDPAFMLANMMRDSLSAYVTSGVKMTPLIDTFKNFGKAIAGQSPELEKLYAAGVLGGYDYSRGVATSGEEFQKRLREVSGTKTTFEKITSPATSLWGALEKGTQASDAATRMEVFKRVLAETGNEAEAYWQALEVMNFNRKGNSPVVRVLTAAIPFLNARMQGLDLLFRTAVMPMGTGVDAAKQRMKTFWVRGMTLMALSSMYWLLTHDDEDYKKQEQETKDNFWLIPSLGVKIPIPFEVGVMFKVIPERIMQLSFGTDTNKDFTDSMKRQFVSTFGFNLIPQAVLPFYEVKTNHSFFTDRPIIGKGLEDVAPQFQIGPSTSRVAELIGTSVGFSPIKVDHLIKGYTGTIGQYAADLFDMVYDMNSDAPKASKRFEQMPIIRRFAVDPEARGAVTAYYGLKDQVDEVVRSSNLLERSMNFKEYGPYMTENIKMLAAKDYLNDLEKTMKDYREMRQVITSSTMSADAKRDALKAIGKMESSLTANIQTLKKQVQ